LWFLPISNFFALCDTVRQTSLAIHQYFRSGHLEKVYENTLLIVLRNKAIDLNNGCGLIARQISLLIFGKVLDRHLLGV
jgi:hypothetical protein